MKKYLSIIFSLITLLSIAQPGVFVMKLEVKTSGDKERFTVVLQSPSGNKRFETNGKGVLEINSIKYGEEYYLILSKDSYVSKTIRIDAKTGYFSEENNNDIIEVVVEVVPELEYIDYGIVTDTPVGEISINPETGSLENNENYGQNRKLEIDAFLAKQDEMLNEQKSLFDLWLKEVTLAIDRKDFKEAKKLLEKAEEIEENKQVLIVRESLENAIRRESDEKKLIAKITNVADSLFELKNYEKSILLYKRLVRLDPENDYAKGKIEEINILLVNMENNNSGVVKYRITTETIIARAMSMQERRIEEFRKRMIDNYGSRNQKVE